MPSWLLKHGVWAFVAALMIMALAVAAVPFIASTQIVRDRVTHEMSAWSGFRVHLGEAPEIQIWPFRAVLRNVTLSAWDDDSMPPVIEAERVVVDLSAMSALRGDVVFSKVRFVRPVVRLVESDDGFYLPVLPSTGRIVRAVEIGREAIAASPENPDLAALPADGFGTIEFSDGRIVIWEDGRDTELITSAAGTGNWPALNRAGSASLNGIWRGEPISIQIASPQPLVLFGGGTTAVTFSLEAAPLKASFDGSASLSQGFVEGNANLSSPSLRRALQWSRMHIAPGGAIGAVSLDAHVSGTGRRFRFQDAKITIEGSSGVGVLDVSVAEETPSVSGTLAFERMDLQSFVSAFTAPEPNADGETNAIETAFTDQVSLDLRLSAASATAGAISLANVAATAQVKAGLAVFDISDATAFGGTLQAGFRLDRTPAGARAELRMHASDIDSAALAKAAGATRILPQGAATISMTLQGPITDWRSLLESTEGNLSVTMREGAVAGIGLPVLLERAAKGGFFPLLGASEGSLALQDAELTAALSRGVATIEKAEASTPHGAITLSGIVPYIGRGLALSGTISPTGDGEEVSFFVGGPWNAPFVSPIVPELPDQRW